MVPLSQQKWVRMLGLTLLASLILMFWWDNYYYKGPTAAYYELARALEAQDGENLAQLTDYSLAQLGDIAKPHGGMRNLGKAMRGAPDVNIVNHIISVEAFATVGGKPMRIHFNRRRIRRNYRLWVAVVISNEKEGA